MKQYHATIKKSARSIIAMKTLKFKAQSINGACRMVDLYLKKYMGITGNRQPYVRIIQL